MLTVDQALEIILGSVKDIGHESIGLHRACGRILAEDVIADSDLPPFDRARMDGYALRSEDATLAPVTLRLIGEVPAGASFNGSVASGEAVKIFTGAPVPDGANAVQKMEVTKQDGATVTIYEPAVSGQFITPRASEIRTGDVAAARGREIGPAGTAVLASFGYASIRVARRPRIAVLSTGDELVDVSEKPTGAQIRSSNGFTIASYASRAGAQAEILGIVRDTLEETVKALEEASLGRDIVITSGGVSMGDYDLVKAALTSIGAELYFDKVSIRPGKPTVFARRGDTYFFGLPGNPVSTSVTFNVFVRPAIKKMLGAADVSLPAITACASRGVKDGSSRRSFLPASVFVRNARLMAEPLKWGGSSDLVAFMKANGLIVVPEDLHQIHEGGDIQVLLLNPF